MPTLQELTRKLFDRRVGNRGGFRSLRPRQRQRIRGRARDTARERLQGRGQLPGGGGAAGGGGGGGGSDISNILLPGRTGSTGLQRERERATGTPRGPTGAALASQSISQPQDEPSGGAQPSGAAQPPGGGIQQQVQQILDPSGAAERVLGETAAPAPSAAEESQGQEPVLSPSPVSSQTPRQQPEGFPLIGGGQIQERGAEAAAEPPSRGSPAPFDTAPSEGSPLAISGLTRGLEASRIPGATGGGLGVRGSAEQEGASPLFRVIQLLLQQGQ